ncbi:MAG: PorV/PorQ family protein [Ignavibacteriae bacterium]|nr:PorV/PorQ family protein [Ignavibacteriota bacterium]
MKKRWCVLGFVLASMLSVSVAGTSVGKYAGEFISLGVGGRALGMGGAFVALANDVTSGYWNPAGLSHITYPQISLMHDERYGSLVNYDYGAVALPVGPSTSWGFSVIRLGVDDIMDTRNAAYDPASNVYVDYATYRQNPERYRIDPSKVTYFNAADWAFYLTYSKKQSEDFSYGANLKVIRRDLGDASATGLGLDVGLWYTPMDNVLLGANLQDVTTTFLAWNTGTNELITPTMKIGTAYLIEAFGGRFAPAIDFDIRFEGRKYASTFNLGNISFDPHFGTEFMFKDVVAFRVGYNDVKQWSMGAGLHLPKLNIDYSYAQFSQTSEGLGNTHRISLMFTLEAEQFRRVDGY